MTAEEVLRENESQALSNNQIISKVNGRMPGRKKKWLSFSATGLIIGIVVVIAVLFSSGNMIPSAISERLIEETDVQYADAVESKKIVFQQALLNGEIPEDTAKILKKYNVQVGYFKNEEFVEGNKTDGKLFLKQGDKIIAPEDFITEINANLELYNAFNSATYSRAAYYYDEEANKIFKEIGTTRNNYSIDSDFDNVMAEMLGEGSDIDINTVGIANKSVKDENGKTEVVQDYVELGNTAKSDNAVSFINTVGDNNRAGSVEEATLNTADSLKAADSIAKENRSSLFFLTFMENISKMKAGEGNESKITDAMNYLYKTSESEVVDVNTGKVIKTTGAPLDSPSLYAVLSGAKVNAAAVENYSTDRILKTIQNQLEKTSINTIPGTVVSTSNKSRGSVGRFASGNAAASKDLINLVEPTINSSLVNNSYETIKGIDAGEFLVEGAINVGKKLAKASGASAGDVGAVMAYQKLNSSVLAMDAKLDRLNRSPFDITSKNTFLGSIFYNVASILVRGSNNSLWSGLKVLSTLTSKSIISFLPSSYADTTESYLTNFGDCETIGTIGAVGSAQCIEIATFDTSTLNDPFNDPGFRNFIETNTSLNSFGTRTINKNSILANYILYNNERKTPIGMMDGGILNSLGSDSSSVSFMSNIVQMIKEFLGSSEVEKKIASGEAFVNSKDNPDWQTYKYAQRYVSLARATATLKQYSNNSAAYNNIKYFEGTKNPVATFLNSFYASNNNLMITEVSN